MVGDGRKNRLSKDKKLSRHIHPTDGHITPDDMNHFMATFSGDSVPDDHAPLDFSAIHAILSDFEKLSEDHREGILELGKLAAKTSNYGEVSDYNFGWGYYLYSCIKVGDDVTNLLGRSFKQVVSDPSFAGHSVIDAVRNLNNEASLNTGFLFDAADYLLDGIVEQHDRIFGEEDESSEFERQEIRNERLKVLRAGTGLACRHWLESME